MYSNGADIDTGFAGKVLSFSCNSLIINQIPPPYTILIFKVVHFCMPYCGVCGVAACHDHHGHRDHNAHSAPVAESSYFPLFAINLCITNNKVLKDEEVLFNDFRHCYLGRNAGD